MSPSVVIRALAGALSSYLLTAFGSEDALVLLQRRVERTQASPHSDFVDKLNGTDKFNFDADFDQADFADFVESEVARRSQFDADLDQSESGADELNFDEAKSLASGMQKDVQTYASASNATLSVMDASSQKGIILRHMPKHKTSICSCAKCGSTSLWDWVFLGEFGHEFREDTDRKVEVDSAQDVERSAWKGTFEVLQTREQQAKALQDGFSFALVRDPKERLVSAWKSKMACGDKAKYGTDVKSRTNMVSNLLNLWGRADCGPTAHGQDNEPCEETCLSLERWTRVMRDIHQDGHDHMLNAHFLPQNKGCFAHQPPALWTSVVDVVSSDPFERLATHMKYAGRPTHKHQSHQGVLISDEALKVLNKITAQEYAVLSPYLSRPSLVTAGSHV